MIELRFVQGSEFSSKLIELRENTATPLIPSHVELVCPPSGYLGALLDGGVQIRQVGYDKGTFDKELFVRVPGDQALAMDYATSKVGRPYDWAAILDYALPFDLHLAGDYICSALMAATLVAGKTFYKLPVPNYLISPRDLLLMCGAITSIAY